MNFQTHYTHQSSKPEQNHGPVLVEVAGYISAQKRIENMILAGQRLIAYRREQFDFEEGSVDEDFNDPTRSSNYDLADAFQTEIALKERMISRQEYEKERFPDEFKSEPSQAAPKAPNES